MQECYKQLKQRKGKKMLSEVVEDYMLGKYFDISWGLWRYCYDLKSPQW